MNGLKLIENEFGYFEKYDDTYDLTIHCKSQEEQDNVLAILQQEVDNELQKTVREVLENSNTITLSIPAYFDLITKAQPGCMPDPTPTKINGQPMTVELVREILSALWRSKKVEYEDKHIRAAIDIALQAIDFCEIWPGCQVVAPKGTYEKLYGKKQEGDDV